MSRLKLILILCVSLATLGTAISALPTNQDQHDRKLPLQIRVKTHPSQVSPGQKIWVAVEISIDRGWHIYGNPKGPGPGLPTILEAITHPQGIQPDPARFLPAQRITEEELKLSEWVWVYTEQTTIYMRFSTSAAVPPDNYRVGLRLRALLCREGICMPYKKDLTTNLELVGSPDRAGTISHQVRKAIENTHVAKSTSTAAMTIASPSIDQSVEHTTDQLTEIPKLHPRPLHRVLEVSGFLKAVVFSLLAGFILNFTPCVLPVVSLKVLGFVHQAQESRHRVSLIGLSFSAGIVIVFLVLAGLAGFAGYGWGDLFQKREFLIAMIALVFAMSLSLFGIFQLPIPHFGTSSSGVSTQRQGYLESFYKGTLATLLATPCSGPLLGGALAWTFRQPPVQIFAVFACLGVGMSFPYVIMSFYPAALRWLPRPGNWIIHFERFMGFALLATAVYLLTILPEGARIWIVLLCLFLAIGLYMWGQMTTLSDSFRRRLVVRLVAVSIMVVGGWLSMEVLSADDRDTDYAAAESQGWQPYSDMKLLEAAKENRWVVVDFTADWCPNCLLVERTALRSRKVVENFREHNVLLLKADLTRDNPPAKRLLQQMGSRSIPFLALFPPGEHFWQPFFLRDIYRAADVLRVLEIAAANKNN